jgi:glycosyltransferase involved in cell wall biosynthesis
MGVQKRNILVIENALGITGSMKSIVHSAQDLQHQFNFQFVIPTASSNGPWLEDLGFLVHHLPFIELRKSAKVLLTYRWKLKKNAVQLQRIIEQNDIEIVHVNDLYNLTAIMARKAGGQFKLVTHVRLLEQSMPSKLYQFWKKMHAKYSDEIVCVSTPCLAGFNDISTAQLIYDRHPREEQFPTTEQRAAPSIKILYLGNYMLGKGHDIAMKAFKNIATKNPDFQLHFYGGDLGQAKNKNFKALLALESKEAGLENQVFFHGHVDDIETTMKAHDMVLNCSQIESFSLVCQEALYFGVPLISTNSGGPADQITNGENGLLLDDFDPSTIAKAIVLLATDLEMRQNFSKNSRARVRANFGTDQTSAKLGALYTKLVAEPAPQ